MTRSQLQKQRRFEKTLARVDERYVELNRAVGRQDAHVHSNQVKALLHVVLELVDQEKRDRQRAFLKGYRAGREAR